MNKEPTEFQYFKAWLLFFTIAIGCSWLISLVIGSFAAAFIGAGGGSVAQARQLVQVISVVISNRPLQPTPSRRDSFFLMTTTLPQIAKLALARRG